MKLSLITIAMLFGSVAFAQGEPTLEISCLLYDQYTNISVTKTIPLIDDSIRTFDDGKVEVNYSETECEDSTSVTFEKEAYDDLFAGKQAYGELDHAGPDLRIQGTVSCELHKVPAAQ